VIVGNFGRKIWRLTWKPMMRSRFGMQKHYLESNPPIFFGEHVSKVLTLTSDRTNLRKVAGKPCRRCHLSSLKIVGMPHSFTVIKISLLILHSSGTNIDQLIPRIKRKQCILYNVW
jgi:hypothetical protein